MSEPRVVLDRVGLFQAGAAVAVLVLVGFGSGAILGVSYASGALDRAVESAEATFRTADSESGPPPPTEVPSEVRAEVPVDAPGRAAPDAPAVEPAEVESGVPAQVRLDPAPLPEPSEVWTVQVGVFGVERNADRMAARLRSRGYDPLVTAVRNRSGDWLRRVHFELHRTEAEALAAARRFAGAEGMPAVAVRLAEDDR